ncbi:hypothetical protein M8J75_014184 [Diaphorina citri]|nr:hypothetical protein M8J75_014184 [Diaphorina citri]
MLPHLISAIPINKSRKDKMVSKLLLSAFLSRHSRSVPFYFQKYYSKNVATKPIKSVKLNSNISKIRNIGISAHIDAGKTTTTERMLFYSGLIKHMGEVHDGNTVTDYMEQERNRGITIRSAAVSINWQNHVINIIDTPGHIDFTMEVEQALNVMDGAVIILDASAGVEAQTLTVWRQADKFSIPRLVYLNKMDRPDANLDLCVKSLRDRFGVTPLVLQIPIVGSKGGIVGIIDLISMEQILWAGDQGSDVLAKKLTPGDGVYEQALRKRGELSEQLADCDNDLADVIINEGSNHAIPAGQIREALRKAILDMNHVPVLCGSSYKNIGVQKLMDAIVDILPSPTERPALAMFQHFGDSLCARAFKVVHDKHRGAVTFFRIYSGAFKKGQKFYNIHLDQSEQITRLLLAEADDYKEVNEIQCGNIAAVTGLKTTMCGDLICSNEKAYKTARLSYGKASKLSDEELNELFNSTQVALEEALSQLQREDPSLRVDTSPDTGQTVLGGMGELHLEIIRDRILTEYKIEADLGPLQIAYKETVLSPAMASTQEHRVLIKLSVLPTTPGKPLPLVSLDTDPDYSENTSLIYPRRLQCIKSGVDSALVSGPKLGCPVVGVRVLVHWLEVGRHTSDPVISSCTTQCVHKALKEAGCILLEPYMYLEIISDEQYVHGILADLSRRRADIRSVEDRGSSKVIIAEAPLSELLGYCQRVRTLSSGRSHFSMEFLCFKQVSSQNEAQAVRNITGFDPV